MVYEFFYVVYIAMLMSMGSGASASNLHPLTILKSNENDGNTYATDGLYVYANDTVLPGADPESFRFVGDYEIDYRIVYYAGTTISGADPETFRTAAGEYATDATTVYYAGSPI